MVYVMMRRMLQQMAVANQQAYDGVCYDEEDVTTDGSG